MAVDIPAIDYSGAPRNRVGVRGVVFGEINAQPCLSIVASPSATYLLPDLVPAVRGISVGSAETRRPSGVVITSDSVIIGGIVRDADIAEQRRWSELKAIFDHLRERELVVREPTLAAPQGSVAEPLSESVRAPFQPLPADATVREIASRIQQLSGLSDARLAGVFRVTRETFNRWRSGAMTNPSVGTRRRLGMVLRVLEELASQDVSISDWLVNPSGPDATTPYDLLREGRVDEVAYLAAAAAAGATRPARGTADEEDLIFDDDDDGWQSVEVEVSDED